MQRDVDGLRKIYDARERTKPRRQRQRRRRRRSARTLDRDRPTLSDRSSASSSQTATFASSRRKLSMFKMLDRDAETIHTFPEFLWVLLFTAKVEREVPSTTDRRDQDNQDDQDGDVDDGERKTTAIKVDGRPTLVRTRLSTMRRKGRRSNRGREDSSHRLLLKKTARGRTTSSRGLPRSAGQLSCRSSPALTAC